MEDRYTDSAYYDDGDEPAQWNAITKPIISLTAYMPRSSRWGWINTGSQTTGADPILEAVLSSHPIFQSVPLGAGNAPEAFYVSVEDSAKHLKVVSNPDTILISTGAWEQWQIPLNTFTSAGVNLGSVKKVIIGVGDRNNPKVGGVGKLYIDDIRVTRIATP